MKDNKKNVMIVADDWEKGEVFSNILTEKYNEYFFESFEGAMDFICLNKKEISIIILDYSLFNQERIELIEQAKKRNSEVRIIIISGRMADDILDPSGKKIENCFLLDRQDEEGIMKIIENEK